MKALVVDDAKVMRLVLNQMLKKIGFEVTEATNGQEGLEKLKLQAETDVALVDCYMPVMDGFDFIRAVRAEPKFQHLPVVMVTGEEEPSQIQKAIDAGANACVPKPFTRESIVEKLAQLGFAVS